MNFKKCADVSRLFYSFLRHFYLISLQMVTNCVIELKGNKIVSGFSQTQQYEFILFYLDNIFRLIDHHQAILYNSE
jgi:hypothetical protein